MKPIPISWLVPSDFAEVWKDDLLIGIYPKDEAEAKFKEMGNRMSPLWQDKEGRKFALKDAPVGAVWDCDWLHDVPGFTGPDGRALCVKCPGGQDWLIDSQASNCTKPGDRTHKCWVRHGKPEDGTLHVDKNGPTCSAGAGSIQTANWHGFLHHGHFVT